MAPPDYTVWPTIANVYALLTASNITPTMASTDLVATGFLDEAIQGMTQLTKRQFLPGSTGEVRYFDGSGTGLQTVDEFIDVTAVEFLMFPQVAGVNVQYWYEPATNKFPNTTLQIFQGPANTNFGYVAAFPQGRRNIKVTGQWGYAATIPADVWMAVLKKAAAGIAAVNSLDAQGKTSKLVDGDASVDYGSDMPGDVAGWLEDFDCAVKKYRRPDSERRRRQAETLL